MCDGQAKVVGGRFDRTGRRFLPSTPPPVFTGDHQGNLVPGLYEGNEERGGQLGGPEEGQPGGVRRRRRGHDNGEAGRDAPTIGWRATGRARASSLNVRRASRR